MAVGVRITGLPANSDEALWTIEAPWWNTHELMADPRFKDASLYDGYTNYEAVLSEAVLSIDDAKALAAKYASKTTLDHFIRRMKDIDRKLANADGSLGRVQITVFEWESGF